MADLLQVKNLHVSFKTHLGPIYAVRGVDFNIGYGETIAIVGESGCGKSVTAKAIMQLIPSPPGKINSGKVIFEEEDLLVDNQKIKKIRGKDIGMIFQDPMTSLNPTMRVGKQIMEPLIKHLNLSKQKAKERSIELLKEVGIPNPVHRVEQYPHQFSGGMRQRAMIATALACRPKLLIADEPTTALDVTIQAQILELMQDIQKKTNTSIILITHDLGIVAKMCQRIIVMYAGKIVETGSAEDIFYRPQHPYTKGLLNTIPIIEADKTKTKLIPINGVPPDLHQPPKGCSFCPRCNYAMQVCKHNLPEQHEISHEHNACCWLHHPLAKQQKELFQLEKIS